MIQRGLIDPLSGDFYDHEEEVYRWESLREEGGGVWGNSTYTVTRKDTKDVLSLLCVSSKDGTARHDWRDFQNIKNEMLGSEWEAVELYPADSRLVDPSNKFYLWGAPKGTFDFGLTVDGEWKRKVLQPNDPRCTNPQRGWEE